MDETKIEPHDGELGSHADKTESENSVHAALGRLTNQRLHSTATQTEMSRVYDTIITTYRSLVNGEYVLGQLVKSQNIKM